MLITTENPKWSDTGRRVDLQVDVFTGGFFSKGDRVFSFKMFALGTEKELEQFHNKEAELAEAVAQARAFWLCNSGTRYYNYTLPGTKINVRIWKSKYLTYES